LCLNVEFYLVFFGVVFFLVFISFFFFFWVMCLDTVSADKIMWLILRCCYSSSYQFKYQNFQAADSQVVSDYVQYFLHQHT